MKTKYIYNLLTQRAQELEKELFLAELALQKAEEHPQTGSAMNLQIAYYQNEIVIIERLQVELGWLIDQIKCME